MHVHYDVRYPTQASCAQSRPGKAASSSEQGPEARRSFFTVPPTSPDLCVAKEPREHKPLTASRFLLKRLRWMTLGYQYDWTNKTYPAGEAPVFPTDIADLLQGLFPDVSPQAGIVNIYSARDTLSLHRDVSEQCQKGLISISLGCDGLFVVGHAVEEDSSGQGSSTGPCLVLRLRSGDAVYMTGKARHAWHGVPKIVAGTCPEWMGEWPAGAERSDPAVPRGPGAHEAWRGWMATRRVNLNVRQHIEY